MLCRPTRPALESHENGVLCKSFIESSSTNIDTADEEEGASRLGALVSAWTTFFVYPEKLAEKELLTSWSL